MITISQATKDAILADPDLGKISDVRIGRKHRVSTCSVMKIRHKNNISPFAKSRHYKSHPATAAIRNDPLLGKVSDVVLGEKHGARPEVISAIRRKKGIDSFRPGSKENPMTPYIRQDPLLGKVTDLYLASKYGVGRRLVTDLRCKLKIPACNPPKTKHTEQYERAPIWSRDYMERWGRPKGIDNHLEWLRERL